MSRRALIAVSTVAALLVALAAYQSWQVARLEQRISTIASAREAAAAARPTPTAAGATAALPKLDARQLAVLRSVDIEWTSTLKDAAAQGANADWSFVARAAAAREATLRDLLPESRDPVEAARVVSAAAGGAVITVIAPDGRKYQGVLPR